MSRDGQTGSTSWLVVWSVVLAVAATPVLATESDMADLPVANPFRCFTCHTSESPTILEAELNGFGEDFLQNGRIWDSELAQIDSDGDGCLNGVEVGDSDGDGELDGNITEQSGNPGVADDCGPGSLVNEQTWSQLKALFDGG